MLIFDGTSKPKRGESIGEYDLYVYFAEVFHWTPQQVDAQDPDFIVELTAKMNARAEHQRLQRQRE